jgi:predicted Rossmann fold nucleotide-binding protein DprA/Smf involved in DNA uptake
MNPRALTKSEVEALFKDYPYKPNSLYVIGTTSWGEPIAIVGTRKPSREAVGLTRELVRELVRNGFKPIITGGAPGIDTVVANELINLRERPVIVRPCLDNNARYWVGRGGVIIMETTQCPNNGDYTKALALRNRLIAGLTRAIIVPEARAWRVGGDSNKPCCGTWYTAIRFGAWTGRRVFILKPLVSDEEVHEAFRVFVRNSAVPVGSIGELLARLRGLFGGWFP